MAGNISFINATTPAALINFTSTAYVNASSTSQIPQGQSSGTISTISAVRISIYVVCLFLGIVGNTLVIITSCLQKQASRSRFLMAHLALTDIIFCLRLPVQIQLELNGHRWDYGAIMCKIFHCVNSMSMLASIGTMTIIAFERYRGITQGVLSKITRSKIIVSIVVVWVVSVITYSPIFIIRNATNKKCKEQLLNKELQQAYSLFLFFMKYVLPLSIIAFCYWKIAQAIRNRPILAFEHETRKNARQRRRERADNRIVRILIVMVVAFAVLTLPASIWWIMYDFGGFTSSTNSMEIIEAFGALVYFQSCVNPIVYFIMDRKFRADVMNLFKCCCCLSVLRRCMYGKHKVDLRPKILHSKKDSSTVVPLSVIYKEN